MNHGVMSTTLTPLSTTSYIRHASLLVPILRSIYIFFFSSRRRHTRCSRDWSSDVCSSDLGRAEHLDGKADVLDLAFDGMVDLHAHAAVLAVFTLEGLRIGEQRACGNACLQIGRASCRERV